MQTLPVVSPQVPAYQVGQQLYGLQYEGQVTGYQPLPEDRIIRMPAEYWRHTESTLQTQLPEDQELQMQQQEELLRQQMMLQQHLEVQQREQEELRVELEQRLLEKQQQIDRRHIEAQQMLEQQQWQQQQLDRQRLIAREQQVMLRLPAEEAVFTSHPYGDSSLPGRDVPAVRQASARGGDGDNDKLQSLLESLEARIDLMAQMQSTRVAIQRRAQALEEMRARENVGDSIAMYDPNFAAQQQDPLAAFGQREGIDLWSYLQEQRDCISQLTREVEGMRSQMKIMSGGVLQPSLEDYPGAGFRSMEEYRQPWGDQIEDAPGNKVDDMERELERQLVDERRQQVIAAQMRMQERSKLYAEISEAQRSTDGGPADALQTLLALPTSANTRATPQTIDLGRSLETHQRAGQEQAWSPPAPKLFGEPPLVAALSSDMCGVNVELSEDGYRATRARGCRQSVALGSAPLVRQASGWYFEVVIQETVSGWVGGLGIGVTRTPPGTVQRVPDKAWRLPGTCIVGYWGCVFLDGNERKTHWRPDDLQAGQRVGFLVTGDGRGDIILFVDDQPVVHVPGAMLAKDMNATSIAVGVPEPMFPIVDIFAATRAVALIRRATPPPRPWDVSNPVVRPASPTVDNMSLGRSSM
mmetsp:Transcript_56596/g.132793  ORF Transcript_56596/g.132793 Transcript_56596/m.132793 type:complete len:640 (+) Transcript_56596:55-1974(+)